ncbi:MAG: flagellar basal body-associated FliL family protein [Pseudomonadota bacterium]
MADEEENEVDEEASEDGEGEDGEKKKKKLSGKVLVLFIALPAVLLIGGGVAAAYFLGFIGGKPDEAMEVAEVEPEEVLPPPVFYDLPEMVVNLNSDGGRAVYLKVKIALELREENPAEVLDPLTPRIVDRFQVFLRQLKVQDLEGSAGMLRLKQELLRRINLVVEPMEVRDILFKEMIIQ